jgi:hypothetical protein
MPLRSTRDQEAAARTPTDVSKDQDYATIIEEVATFEDLAPLMSRVRGAYPGAILAPGGAVIAISACAVRGHGLICEQPTSARFGLANLTCRA